MGPPGRAAAGASAGWACKGSGWARRGRRRAQRRDTALCRRPTLRADVRAACKRAATVQLDVVVGCSTARLHDEIAPRARWSCWSTSRHAPAPCRTMPQQCSVLAAPPLALHVCCGPGPTRVPLTGRRPADNDWQMQPGRSFDAGAGVGVKVWRNELTPGFMKKVERSERD